jgi:hypothetical protein
MDGRQSAPSFALKKSLPLRKFSFSTGDHFNINLLVCFYFLLRLKQYCRLNFAQVDGIDVCGLFFHMAQVKENY